MHMSLLPLLSCLECRGTLRLAAAVASPEIEDGDLRCEACGRGYPVEGGIPILAPRDVLESYADRWPSGLAREYLVSRIDQCRAEYTAGGPFTAWVDAATQTCGVVVDIATGPGRHAPRLCEGGRLGCGRASGELAIGR